MTGNYHSVRPLGRDNQVNAECAALTGKLVADSRDVAALIERPHWIIMRTIRTMSKHLNDNKFVAVDYFVEATYIDEKGEIRPCYYLTEMGCDMVANKQEGERGTIFTAQYVSVTEAAQALGVSRRTMYDLINREDSPR